MKKLHIMLKKRHVCQYYSVYEEKIKFTYVKIFMFPNDIASEIS